MQRKPTEWLNKEEELDEADRILMAPHVRFSMTPEQKSVYYAEAWAAPPLNEWTNWNENKDDFLLERKD